MANAIWDDLEGRLEIVLPPGQELIRPAPGLITTTVNHLEKLAGLSFPTSYREFLLRLGPGELAGHFHIYAPIPEGVGGPANDYYDILKENETIRDPEGDWVTTGDPALVGRLILFASTSGGDWFFWDPADVRDPASHEYGIYARASDGSGTQVELVASSFATFITGVCLQNGYPDTDRSRTPECTFWPAWPTRAKPLTA
jgi:hypothetical protein